MVASAVAKRGLEGAQASVAAACGLSNCGYWSLEHRLDSYGTGTQPLRGMWDLPGPGIEPRSLSLTGRFFTTAPLGSSQIESSAFQESEAD